MSRQPTPGPCECAGSTLYEAPNPKALRYCPLHAAAPALREALEDGVRFAAIMSAGNGAALDWDNIGQQWRAALRAATTGGDK